MRTLVLTACSALLLASCGDPTTIPPEIAMASVPVSVAAAPSISTLVLEVTAPDISPPLVFNLTLQNGTARDTLSIPAGSDRRIVVRAYDSASIETHQGEITTSLVEGSNPAVTVHLDPLMGDQPIVVVLGEVFVSIDPSNDTIGVGGTGRLFGTVVNELGDTLPVSPVWASLQPSIATVDTAGIVTGVSVGAAQVVASYAGVGAAATVVVEEVPTPLDQLTIVYARNVSDTDLTLYSMVGDGTSPRYLNVGTTPTQVGSTLVSRGPYNNNNLYRMAPDGSGRTAIGRTGYGPDLSPDESRIVYRINGGCPSGSHLLRRVDVAGTNPIDLQDCAQVAPRWAPDGMRIVFARNDSLFSVAPDGSDRQVLVDLTTLPTSLATRARGSGLAYSPDGSRWAFSGTTVDPTNGASVFVITTDGSGLTRITPETSSYEDVVYDWSPDGDWILFTSNRTGFWEMYVMRPDGTGVQQLTTAQDTSLYFIPRWVR